jgi:phosphatidylglycerophosphate synthase
MPQSISIEKKISPDRKRTNFFKELEQLTIINLCRIMPKWVTPDLLTFFGFVGSLLVFGGFWLARHNVYFLALSIFGLMVNWFGDSLDGRLAYFRNVPRKWYGFALDMCMDWIATGLMGLGFYLFLTEPYKILAPVFIAGYGWSMIIALLRYKITNQYSIDTGMVGPTELRIGICIMLVIGMINIIALVAIASCVTFAVYLVNFYEFYMVLRYGDRKDKEDRLVRK